MGRIHNLALENISKIPGFPNQTKKETYTSIIQTWDAELKPLCVSGNFQSLEQLEKDAKEIKNKLDGIIEEMFFDGKLNFTEKQKIDEVLFKTQQIKDPAELDGELRAFECTIFKNKELNCKEKAIIGIASVIARSSNAFWTRQLNTPGTAWHTVLTVNGFDENNKFKINWADLIGGVVGCAGCVFFPPPVVNCVVCAGAASTFASNVFGA